MQPLELDFLFEPEDILKCLQFSLENGTVVAINAPILGSGVFLTSVDHVDPSGFDYLITLKGYDMTGYILDRNKVRLSEIRCVCPFTSKFKNPFLKEFTQDKNVLEQQR